MSDQQQEQEQQQVPLIIDAEEPSEESKRLDTIFNDLDRAYRRISGRTLRRDGVEQQLSAPLSQGQYTGKSVDHRLARLLPPLNCFCHLGYTGPYLPSLHP